MASSNHRAGNWSAIPLDFRPPAGLVAVGAFRSQRTAGECGLAILAAGHDYWTLPAGRCFVLCVRPGAVGEAIGELAACAGAAAAAGAGGGVPDAEFVAVEHSWGLIFPFAVLWLGFWIVQSVTGEAWREAGRVDAARIVDGAEWWRAVTALTLHADAGHWLANGLAGGGFAFLVGRYFGSGWNWLLILATGLAGNLANAWLQYPEHTAIGGSTAVFGALGLLTGGSLGSALRGRRRGGALPKWWIPLLGGLVLLGMLGAGGAPEVDVGAHACGFAAGLLLGVPLAPLRRGMARRRGWGTAAATLALAVVALAWLMAVAA